MDEWIVIRAILLEESSSSVMSELEISDTFSRNSPSVTTGTPAPASSCPASASYSLFRSSTNLVTLLTSSSTLEALDCDSIEESLFKVEYSLLSSDMLRARVSASSVSTLEASPLIISQKPLIRATEAALRPNSANFSEYAALKRESPRTLAIDPNAAIEVSPIPREGVLTARLKDSSSLTFTTSFR